MKITVFLACFVVAASCRNVTVSPFSSLPCSQPCGSNVNGTSIDQALGNITSGDYLRLLPGCHCVRTFSIVQDVTDVSLIGDAEGIVQITCAPGLGLAFLNVTRLSFQGLTITGCGIYGSNTVTLYNAIKAVVNLQAQLPREVNIAMVIASCTDVVMNNVFVTVKDTGLGVVGINVVGESNLTNNVFSFQDVDLWDCSTRVVGGGVNFIYVDYVTNTSNDSVELNVENCTFANCSYCGSNAFKLQLAYRYRLADFSAVSPYLLGSGGGLTISLTQRRFSANINTARSLETALTVKTLESGQGCVGLVKDISIPSSESRQVCSFDRPNSLTISRTHFINNLEGGVSIQSFYATPSSVLDWVVIDSCRFESNTARAGSAIYAFERKMHGLEEGTSLLVQNCSFVNNIVTDIRSAVLEVLAMNITVRDSSFLNNFGTALAGDSSVVTLDGKVDFINNSALAYGGALCLISIPFLIVKSSSSISFVSNSASLYGGEYTSIYVDYTFGRLELEFTEQDCFLYFESINVLCSTYSQCPALKDLTVSMTFSNNKAPLGGTFYGIYLDNCPWANQVNKSKPEDTILETMLEHSFIFHLDQLQNTSKVISTPVQKVDVKNISNASSYMPGQKFELQVRALDFYNHYIQAVLSAIMFKNGTGTLVTAMTEEGFPPLLGESGYVLTAENSYLNASLRVYGQPGDTMEVLLNSLYTFTVSNSINIALTECLFGFVYNVATADCQCSNAANLSKVQCDSNLKVFNIKAGWWFGPGPNQTGVVYAECPPGYCNKDIRVLQPEADQCVDNRAGLLCGGCKEGYSAVFGSNRCMKCSNSTLGLLTAFAAAGVGLIVIISIFHITITDGYTYGVVIYASLNSIYAQYYTTLFGTSIQFIPLQWLNQVLGFEMCFYDGMTALDRAGLGLVFPAYLFILMILFIWLAGRSHQLSEWLAKSNFTPSKLVATLIVLSYNSITQSCSQILEFVEVTVYREENGNSAKVFLWATDPNVEYFSPLHAGLFTTAIVLLVAYIIPLPILLILSSCTSRFVWKMKPLYDAFFSPFKDGRTFWIGFSLFMTVVLSSVSTFGSYYIVQALLDTLLIVAIFFYVLCEPYKKWSQNAMFVFFFGNILTLVVLSLCLKQYQVDPQQSENNPAMRTVFTVLASIVLGSGYLVIVLVIIVKLYPKAWGVYLTLAHTLKHRRRHSQWAEEANTSIHMEPLSNAEVAHAKKPPPPPPTFSELREPVMDEGYLNVEFKT
ncbi:hypothetical protein EMCRGX_G022548 [Ephydatia muelleri]